MEERRHMSYDNGPGQMYRHQNYPPPPPTPLPPHPQPPPPPALQASPKHIQGSPELDADVKAESRAVTPQLMAEVEETLYFSPGDAIGNSALDLHSGATCIHTRQYVGRLP
ncbi:hypothetical protein F5883DRAFT_622732 [Diaporthe sp. PMI_573]|nr:hypothetical protein F5883DRAFT_622732 [Diaporthaceae sp. PMI_573]